MRIGIILYHNDNKEPPNIVLVLIEAPISRFKGLIFLGFFRAFLPNVWKGTTWMSSCLDLKPATVNPCPTTS